MKAIIPFLLEIIDNYLGNLIHPGTYLLDNEIFPFLSPLPYALLYGRRGRKVCYNSLP